ncbi:ChaN family lipoprotein [Sulfurihydrogenibium sp.]|uniref:ChaN family lipoprotein n=1 Tax=Sulfurihydrogenibium sp. TaxID=2053621 RepID=UPI00260FA4E4|nr:ChaN family lipoprotein [Sulfurihydrogenibium sp.]
MKLYLSPIVAFIIGFILTFSNALKSYDVILVGEIHTDENDHRIQLSVIKDFYNYNKKVVIAMEMFQQPFQKYLDDFVEGKISEKEFLEKTEYKKRWGFDFKYYKDILNFAKENRIKVFALNIPSEVLKDIKEKGIENIDSPYIPKPIPKLTQQEIKELEDVIKNHPQIKNKQAFFDIQLAWNYSMAYKIYQIKKQYPDYIVIALVGKGHTDGIKRILQILDKDMRIFIYD